MIMQFWFDHFPILSIVLPAFTGFLLILCGDQAHNAPRSSLRLRQSISLASALLGLGLAIALVNFAAGGQLKTYQLSEWSAPFGIVLVVDRLSAMMVLLTYALAVPILWFANSYWDKRGRYFHAVFHFLLMGICGAFLTGDLFNLFVFFEILLIASYVLLLHSHKQIRFQMGVHYVIINLFASALFLIGLGLIYSNVGSLNMADVARLFPTLPTDNHQMALAGAMLLFVVFGIKAAMLPLGFWLPKTYAAAATPVAAVFALMTKVGIYAIIRVNGTIFNDPQGQHLIEIWLLIIGIAGSLYGVLAAIGTDRLRRFIGFMILSSIGTILIAIALFSMKAWAAGLYYLVHSTFIAAVFYLLAEWICAQRSNAVRDHLKIAPSVKQHTRLSLLFLLVAWFMAGLPPFSGFIGKVFLLQGTEFIRGQIWIILAILLVSILSILAFIRVGFILFWRTSRPEDLEGEEKQHYDALPQRAAPRLDTVIYGLLALLVIYTACAEPIYRYTYATAEQLQNKALYQHALLKRDANGQVISVQPFDAQYIPHSQQRQNSPDINQGLIPYIISPKTLAGEHIQLEQLPQPTPSPQPQLVPAENHHAP